MHNLQRGAIRRRRWDSWKVHDHVEEMVTTTVRMKEHVQTMGRHAATVGFLEVTVSVVAMIAIMNGEKLQLLSNLTHLRRGEFTGRGGCGWGLGVLLIQNERVVRHALARRPWIKWR